MKKHLLSILALSFSFGSIAQIVYTDIVDITLTPVVGRESLAIDLDDDGTMDFKVFALDTAVQAQGQSVPVKAIGIDLYGNNMVDGTQQNTAAGSFLAVTVFESAAQINSSSNFMGSNSGNLFEGGGLSINAVIPFVGSTNAGNFTNKTDKYIAVKFEIGVSIPTTHYGWIRVSVANNAANVIIKDFAYESTPSAAIRAGDSGAGFAAISTKELANASVYYANNELNIKGISGVYSVSVIDLLGKSVLNKTVSNVNSINLTDVNNGIYLVKLAKGSSVITKKIYIK